MKHTIKRTLAMLLAALLLCCAVPFTASAAGVDITDKFTDPAFRAAVQELIGKDVILDTDVAGITTLNVEDMGIQSLAGLEYFDSLAFLYCSYNKLTALPAPLPSGLIWLYCSINPLKVLPELPSSLTHLGCVGNQLKTLPALPATLKVLDCWSNYLTELDVTGLNLDLLGCMYNLLPDKSAVIGFTGVWGGSFAFDPQWDTESFVPVTNIWGVPEKTVRGTSVPLPSQVHFNDTPSVDIFWSIEDAGTTGAALAGNVLTTTSPGTVKVKATVFNGTWPGEDFTQTFDIIVKKSIRKTDLESTFWNWFKYLFLFGWTKWIWMWI